MAKTTYFHYDPSMEAAIILLVLFFFTSALHTYQLVRTKAWFFTAFVVGGWFEVIGFAGRIYAIDQYPDTTKPPYIINVLFPLVAPALYAASIYMALGRILIITGGESYSLVPTKWLTKIFVFGDVASFVLVGIGGAMVVTASDSLDQYEKGRKIVIAGLLVQIIFFTLFMFTATLFNWRIHRHPTPKLINYSSVSKPLQNNLHTLNDDVDIESDPKTKIRAMVPYQLHLNALYLASLLILVRSVFKLVEYLQGRGGYIFSQEWMGLTFDAGLMVATMLVFHFVHPSQINGMLNEGGKVVRGWGRVVSWKVGGGRRGGNEGIEMGSGR